MAGVNKTAHDSHGDPMGVYDLEVANGDIVAVHGISADPNPTNWPSLTGWRAAQQSIKRPSIRKGLSGKDCARQLRGADSFVDSLGRLELAAVELKRVSEQFGNRAILAPTAGPVQVAFITPSRNCIALLT